MSIEDEYVRYYVLYLFVPRIIRFERSSVKCKTKPGELWILLEDLLHAFKTLSLQIHVSRRERPVPCPVIPDHNL